MIARRWRKMQNCEDYLRGQSGWWQHLKEKLAQNSSLLGSSRHEPKWPGKHLRTEKQATNKNDAMMWWISR